MRLKLKANQNSTTLNIDLDQSFKQFLEDVKKSEKLHTDISENITQIKTGFPPKAIDLDYDIHTTIKDKGIKDGDQLLIEFSSNKRKSDDATIQSIDQKKSTKDIPSVFIKDSNKYLVLRNIPDDNSCLFNSISYALSGIDYPEISPPQELRKVIVDYIKKDEDLYSEVILGRPRDDYCNWIIKKDSWGGAIELGILADWFNIRIICIDIESGNFLRFQNESNKPSRYIILIYSGIHYDVLSLNKELLNKETDESVWELEEDENIIDAAHKLCKNLQTRNYSTNTTTFRVRCLDCYSVLVGEMGASNHANETGHLNFGEVK